MTKDINVGSTCLHRRTLEK